MRKTIVRTLVSAAKVIFGTKSDRKSAAIKPRKLRFDTLEDRLAPATGFGYYDHPFNLEEVGTETAEKYSVVTEPLGSSHKVSDTGVIVDTRSYKQTTIQSTIETTDLLNETGGHGSFTKKHENVTEDVVTIVTTIRPDASRLETTQTETNQKYTDEEIGLYMANLRESVRESDLHRGIVQQSRVYSVASDAKGYTYQSSLSKKVTANSYHSRVSMNEEYVYMNSSMGMVVYDQAESYTNWDSLDHRSWKDSNASSQQGMLYFFETYGNGAMDGSFYSLNETATSNDFTITRNGASERTDKTGVTANESHAQYASNVFIRQSSDSLQENGSGAHSDVSQKMTWVGKDDSKSTTSLAGIYDSVVTSLVTVAETLKIDTINQQATSGALTTGTATIQVDSSLQRKEMNSYPAATDWRNTPAPLVSTATTYKETGKPKFVGPISGDAINNMAAAKGYHRGVVYANPTNLISTIESNQYGYGCCGGMG